MPDSTYVPIAEMEKLLVVDIEKESTELNSFLKKYNIKLEQHQYDALVSFTHQYGQYWWTKEPPKVLPQFIIDGNGVYDPQEVERIFAMHNDKSRRAKEASVFNYGY